MFTFQCAFIKTFWKLNKQTKGRKGSVVTFKRIKEQGCLNEMEEGFHFVFWGC